MKKVAKSIEILKVIKMEIQEEWK
jgi:hypothetical protein